jgi:hypothetical protein
MPLTIIPYATASSITGSSSWNTIAARSVPMNTTSYMRATPSAASRSRSKATFTTVLLLGILLPEPAAANALRRLAWGRGPA